MVGDKNQNTVFGYMRKNINVVADQAERIFK